MVFGSFIYAGVAVLLCYINNITFYAACIAINERRVAMNRHYLFCHRIKTKDELRKDHKSSFTVMCCGGQRPTNREESESMFDKFPRWLFPKLVLNLPCKIVIIIGFIAYLVGGIYGCIHLKQGLLFTQLVAKDSYFHEYSRIVESDFERLVPVSFIFTDSYTYSDPNTKRRINSLIAKAQGSNLIQDNFKLDWLSTYSSTPYFDNSNETNFITGLRAFLNVPQFAAFENDVVINPDGTSITTSRVHVLSNDLEGSQEEGDLMIESRDIADNADIKCFAYSPLYVVAEQYISILGQSLQNVGIALAAVFVITCIFMPHPVLILFVTIAVTMIMIGVFGYMYYVDVALSAITMVHLIMSVGFSIDFTAHICHGYMISNGGSRDLKVTQAIDKTGAPIFHGAISSLVGIATLAMATSYVFTTFATVMAFVIGFGIAHALLLLPVLLSWVGPTSSGVVEDETSEVIEKKTKSNGVVNKSMTLDDEQEHKSNISKTNGVVGDQTDIPMSDVVQFRQHSAQYRLNTSQDGRQSSWTKDERM